MVTADVGPELSITGSTVGTVKLEHQATNVDDMPSHSTEHSRPASKWCMYCFSDCLNEVWQLQLYIRLCSTCGYVMVVQRFKINCNSLITNFHKILNC